MVLAALSTVAEAQDQASESDRFTDGLIAGDYVRLTGGLISPLHPRGNLADWNRGRSYGLAWENWQSGSGGVGRVGFSLGVNYGLLPFDEGHFLGDFVAPDGARATSATASDASVLEIETGVRLRIPAPFILPSFSLGFGYINIRPSTIHYISPSVTGTTGEQHRYGGEITLGAGLDKQVIDRFAVFGEAAYTYGFTGLGQGFAQAGGTCATSANGCDPLKNTMFTTIRGGLRVRVGR